MYDVKFWVGHKRTVVLTVLSNFIVIFKNPTSLIHDVDLFFIWLPPSNLTNNDGYTQNPYPILI